MRANPDAAVLPGRISAAHLLSRTSNASAAFVCSSVDQLGVCSAIMFDGMKAGFSERTGEPRQTTLTHDGRAAASLAGETRGLRAARFVCSLKLFARVPLEGWLSSRVRDRQPVSAELRLSRSSQAHLDRQRAEVKCFTNADDTSPRIPPPFSSFNEPLYHLSQSKSPRLMHV